MTVTALLQPRGARFRAALTAVDPQVAVAVAVPVEHRATCRGAVGGINLHLRATNSSLLGAVLAYFVASTLFPICHECTTIISLRDIFP